MTSYTHDTVPTQFVEANGIHFAYRRFGKTGGAPIVMNVHFRGTMDHWDPAVTNGLAPQREVILFDNAGIGASSGETPASIPAMATDAIAFIKALGIGKADILGYSVGGKVAQEIVVQAPDLVRKLILVGTGPRGADTAASKSAEIFSATYDPPEHLWIAAHFLPNAAGRAAGLKYLERKFRRQDRSPEVSEASATAQYAAIVKSNEKTDGVWDYLAEIRHPLCSWMLEAT
jgi:pimeloyl-ACP methyl ester carboxylesterase